MLVGGGCFCGYISGGSNELNCVTLYVYRCNGYCFYNSIKLM